jgi:hypothetical protein
MNERRRMRPGLLALALAFFVPLPPAWSQPDSPWSEAAKKAEEHFLRGKTFMKSKQTRAAYEEYKAAWELKKSYDIAANLGNVELQLGMPRDAAEHLAFSLRSYSVLGTTPDQLRRMKKKLAEAQQLIATIRLRVSVDGAEVFVDQRSIGRAPFLYDVYVDPGSRVFEAQLGGFDPVWQTVDAQKGASQTVMLTLLASAAPPASAAPAARAAPAASSSAPLPPPAASSAPVGDRGGAKEHEKSLVPGLVLGGAGLVAGGIGIGMFVAAGSEASQANKLLAQVVAREGVTVVCPGAPECVTIHSLR